jgi:hypothetical protein
MTHRHGRLRHRDHLERYEAQDEGAESRGLLDDLISIRHEGSTPVTEADPTD